MQPCRVCGGTTSPNPKKVPTKFKPIVNPKLPDFICNQDMGRCGSDVQYTNYKGEVVDGFNPTPAWKPKEGGFDQYATRPTPVAPGTPMVKAPAGQDGFVPAKTTPDPIVIREEPDWDKITEGKVRHGVICALLQAGRTKEEILDEYELWTRLIIIGSPI